MNTINDYKIITGKEVNEKYPDFAEEYIYRGIEPEEKVAYYEGDTEIESFDLHDEELQAKGIVGIIVKGSLKSDEVFSNDTDAMFLFVVGDVKAKSLYTAGADIYIKGNAVFENYVMGYYNHGYVYPDSLTTKYFIPENHDISTPDDTINALYALDFRNKHENPGKYHYTDVNVLLPELIIEEEGGDYVEPDYGLIMEYLEEGKEILKEEFRKE